MVGQIPLVKVMNALPRLVVRMASHVSDATLGP